MGHLSADLCKLAEVAVPFKCWPLQSLILSWDADCEWNIFSVAMMQLSAVLPNVQQLSIWMPTVGVYLTHSWQPGDNAQPGAEAVPAEHAGNGAADHFVAYPKGIKSSADYATTHQQYTKTQLEQSVALAAVASVTALGNALLKLTKLSELRKLTVSELPDIWCLRVRAQGSDKSHLAARQIAASVWDTTMVSST